ncbi:MAG: hypothetical protein GY842_17545 [bacterium]|nr:hypothetical protein [bacterium]
MVDHCSAGRAALGRLLALAGLEAVSFPSIRKFSQAYVSGTGGCLVFVASRGTLESFDFPDAPDASRIPTLCIVQADDVEVATVVRAMKSGCVEFVVQPYDDAYLLSRIRSILHRHARHESARMRRSEAVARLSDLTPREREVLERVLDGETSREIAARLGVRTKTIESHRTNMMRRAAVANQVELIRIALAAQSADEVHSLFTA